ncbi:MULTISPECIES: YitT family protein [unclassified Microbacterium]|uniref:YitT family protein n=1 Tax=unclassified Microbacterium TaxID=2609290 RepID=UPI00214C2F89|nr:MULTISPECIES: YitT family protein [unclassified Microbacterium]MCR2784864.1 YitT family protein [Microbacterium sp. zg.B96]MDL5352683.1 YitT family protein [Microbacterium sp. zg-YB36]WIM16402.1 YitT family protein [Microbacterium sp. zg-B96]
MTETGPSLVFDKKATEHSVAEDVLGMLSGTFAASFGLYLLNASEAVTGGTAGLSLLLGFATGWPFWLLFAVINVPFAVLAVWKRGWAFTARTVIAIGLVSSFSVVHERLFTIEYLDPVYGALAGNLMAGIGLLIVFRHGGSLGGFNVIALILQDATGFRAGWTLMIFDLLVVVAGLLVVPWPNVVLSALGAVLLNLVLALNHRPGRYIGR